MSADGLEDKLPYCPVCKQHRTDEHIRRDHFEEDGYYLIEKKDYIWLCRNSLKALLKTSLLNESILTLSKNLSKLVNTKMTQAEFPFLPSQSESHGPRTSLTYLPSNYASITVPVGFSPALPPMISNPSLIFYLCMQTICNGVFNQPTLSVRLSGKLISAYTNTSNP